ncbi:MAG: hypothetical protein AAGG11_05385 [Pseudomonadota bacterium]
MSTTRPRSRTAARLLPALALTALFGAGVAQAHPPVIGKIAHHHHDAPFSGNSGWNFSFNSVVGPFHGLYFGTYGQPLSFHEWRRLERQHRRYVQGVRHLPRHQRLRRLERGYARYLRDFHRYDRHRLQRQWRRAHRHSYRRDLLAEHRARRFDNRVERRIERKVERRVERRLAQREREAREARRERREYRRDARRDERRDDRRDRRQDRRRDS